MATTKDSNAAPLIPAGVPVSPPKKPHPAQATYTAKTSAYQEAFLAAYPSLGTVKASAAAAHVTDQAVWNWIQSDHLGFKERYLAAQRQWAEHLEDLARKRVEEPSNNGRTGSDVLLIAMLNANYPSKWRRDTVIVGSDSVVNLIAEIQKLAAKAQAPVVEGEVRDITVETTVAKMLSPGDEKPPREP